MASSNLIRWSGLATILGGALLLISDLLGLIVVPGDLTEAVTTGAYLDDSGVRLLGGMLLLVGLVGLYARQAEASGALGLIGFLAAFAGTSLMIGAFWTNTFVPPALAVEAPEFLATGPAGTLGFGFMLSFAVAALGWLLFGAATFKTRVYPRAASVLLMVGAALTFIPLPASGVIFAAAVAWFGYALFLEASEAAKRSVRAA